MIRGEATASGATAGDLSFTLGPASMVPELAQLWRDLETRADGPFFLSWNWIGAWLALSGVAPLLLTARLDGVVVGLALLQPARLRRHFFVRPSALLLHEAGDPEHDALTIEYNGILADRRCAEIMTDAALRFLAREAGCDELHFSGVCDAFAAQAERGGMIAWIRRRSPTWRVDLDALRRAGRPYLATLSANTRSQIRRAMRLYERRGALALYPARDASEAVEFLASLKALHQRYWQSRGLPGSFTPFFERFHRTLVTEGTDRGCVELVRVTAGDHVIGYVYNFLHCGHVYNYQTGFAYDDDPRLKPGLVSHALCIERHLQRGARVYDFLAGDHRYKRNLGVAGPEMVDLVLQRASPLLAIERALRRLKSALATGRTERGDRTS